jgi:hypothetical protein
MRFVANIPILWAALHTWFDGRPRLQLGGTVLIGRHLQLSNVDFFGGTSPEIFITTRSPHFSIFQVSPLPSLQSPTFAFLVLALSILFLPCDRSMPVASVSRAYSQ